MRSLSPWEKWGGRPRPLATPWSRSSPVLVLLAAALFAQSPKYGLGRTPSPEEIHRWDVSISPDGTGLPEGSGTAAAGKEVYANRCAKCHGAKGEGRDSVPLAGGQGTLKNPKPLRTVGSYWPYTTTIWDYVNRRQLLALHHHHLGLCEPGDALQQSRHADPRPGVLGNSLHPVFERDHLRDRRGGRSHLAQSPYAQSRGLRRRHPPRRDSPPEAISQIVRKPARKWAFRPQAGVAGGTACPTHACSKARGLVLVGQAVSPGVSSMMSSLAQVIVELNLFPVGWITYYRFAACRFELQCLDEWIRRKLRCYRLKQRKRGCALAGFLRRLGVSAIKYDSLRH